MQKHKGEGFYKTQTCYIDNNGMFHCEDGPAVIYYYDKKKTKIVNETYYMHGKFHREDGPADIWYDGQGKPTKHAYYINGKRHREDGPAKQDFVAGMPWGQSYYLNDENITEKVVEWEISQGLPLNPILTEEELLIRKLSIGI